MKRLSARRSPSGARTRWTCTTAGSRRTRAPAPSPSRRRCRFHPPRANPPRTDLSEARASPRRCRRSPGLDPPPLAGADPAEVVAQDLRVVKAELPPRDLALAEPARFLRVVARLRLGPGGHPAGVHGGDGVLARIAARIRIGEELRDQLHVQSRLLLRFPAAGGAELRSPVHEASRERPPERLVPAQDEDDPAVGAGDDRLGGGDRVAVPRLGAHGITSPDGVGCGWEVFCSRRSCTACVKSARQNGLVASFSNARATASAVRAASSRFSEARTCAISTSRLAYRPRRCGVK